MNRLSGKIILVTGATSDIALAFVRIALREDAAAVIMTGIDETTGKAQAMALGPRCTYMNLDVTSESDWKQVMHWVKQRYQHLHVLVNNAGISGMKLNPPALGLEGGSMEAWRQVMLTNLDSLYLGCREAIALMKDAGKCAIVNIGSRSGLNARHDRMAYAASKAAALNLTKSIAMHCAAAGLDIRCNIVQPSTILTGMWTPLLGKEAQFNHELYQKISAKIPMRRFGEPEEVANAILFLASDESSYITGTEILVDGGAQASDALRMQ